MYSACRYDSSPSASNPGNVAVVTPGCPRLRFADTAQPSAVFASVAQRFGGTLSSSAAGSRTMEPPAARSIAKRICAMSLSRADLIRENLYL